MNRPRRDEKLIEMVNLANKSEKQIAKADYKTKQKIFRAKSGLSRIFYNSDDPAYRGKPYVR